MKKERVVGRDDSSPEVASTLSPVVEDGEPTNAKRSKITKDDTGNCETPELLDERVGNANPYIVRIPRTAITLNLNSHNGQNGGSAKKNAAHARPSTEIRLADSSVPDLVEIGNEEIIVPMEKSDDTNKPRTVEDVTCLGETIFSTTSLRSTRKKKRPMDTDDKSARISVDDNPPKKSRINEKFRCLFGSEVTLSESDEENRITEKLTSRKRRNESRMSSDSGVCLSDQISDIVSVESPEKPRENGSAGEYLIDNLEECPTDNFRQHHKEYIRGNSKKYAGQNMGECPNENLTETHKLYAEGNPEECTGDDPREYSRERLQEYPGEHPKNYSRKWPKKRHRENPSEGSRKISSMKRDDMEFGNAAERSMPLLDAVGDQRAEEAKGEALPDSSTSLFEKNSAPTDSSSGGKLTILVTPLNVQDSDAFDPLRLELDLPDDTHISTPTSTTSGPLIVEPIKLEKNFEEPENSAVTDVEPSCPIGMQDCRTIIKENFSPEADTDSCDGDRLVIAEDIDLDPDQSPTEPNATGVSSQVILGTIANVDETRWQPDSMIGSDKNLTNRTDVGSSSDLNATAVKSFNKTKNIARSSLPIEKIPKSETDVMDRERAPKDPLSVTRDTSGTHNKLLILSAAIVDIDPESGLLIGPAKPVNVLDGVSTIVSDDNFKSGPVRLNIKNSVSESPPKNVDKTIASNNVATLSEVSRNSCSLTGPPCRKSENSSFELTLQGVEDLTKVSQSLGRELPDLEIPKCVLDVQKPKDIPKAPSFRVLHPSELGSRWCPTPLNTDVPQNQHRFLTNSLVAQTSMHPPIHQLSPYTLWLPQVQSQIPSCSPALRHPLYPPIRQTSPEVLIQTPPPSPLEQMQFLVSQKSTSGPGVEDLTANKSSGYLNASLGPRPVAGSGYSPNWVANSVTQMEKQYSLMGRILDCLLSMNHSFECMKHEYNISTIQQLNRDFNTKQSCLFAQLGWYANIQGTTDLRTTVTRIMSYYDYHVPPERRVLNVEKTLYMLQLDHATTMTRAAYPAKAPPPYRPTRTSVTQGSLFTEAQRQILYSQIAAYRRLSQVLHYQLLAQRCAEQEAKRLKIAEAEMLKITEAAKPKRTRRRNFKAPAGQKQVVQAPIAQVPQQPNLATESDLRGRVAAPIDLQSSLQQTVGSTIESTIEQILRSKDISNNTGPDRRDEQTIELTLHDPSIDAEVANIVNNVYRQYPGERMTEGQTVERNFHGQLNGSKAQGQNLEGDVQGQTIGADHQGQRMGTYFQGQRLAETVRIHVDERNSQNKTIESSTQCQTAERNFQGRIIEESVQGQSIYVNVQGQAVEERGQVHRGIEDSCQGQVVEGKY